MWPSMHYMTQAPLIHITLSWGGVQFNFGPQVHEGGGGRRKSTIPGGGYFFRREPPPRGGGLQKKLVLHKKHFPPVHTSHTYSWSSHFITCHWHWLAFL